MNLATRAAAITAASLLTIGLAGCGSDDSKDSSSSSSEKSSAAASATPSESASATESPSESASAAAAKNACTLVSKAQVGKLTGGTVKDAKDVTVAGTSTCTYMMANMGKDPIVTTSTSSITDVDAMIKAAETAFKGAKISDAKISGADEGKYMIGKIGPAPAVGIVAKAQGYGVQVFVADPSDGNAAQVKKAADAMIEELIKNLG